MSTANPNRRTQELLEKELYFIISKFLGRGPCKEAAEVLRREIEEHHWCDDFVPQQTWPSGSMAPLPASPLAQCLAILRWYCRGDSWVPWQGGSCRQQLSTQFYVKAQLFRRLLGHLSSVYCVLFDRSGNYIFTGADDLLPWLPHLGFVRTQRGNRQFLVSTGNDGCACFWDYSSSTKSFNPKPLKFTERIRAGSQMICSSFSPGGAFLATGSTDHFVRVYHMLAPSGPERIAELEAHADQVDSLQFANHSCRFVSGSKDGTANVWTYERQQWRSTRLRMATKLVGSEELVEEDPKQRLKVTMVGWNQDDHLVVTAVNDHSIKVWDSHTGKLKHILLGHEDEAFVLESHPEDSRILLSGGHDGRIIIWDLIAGCSVRSFFNMIEGQGHGAVFDCKFSPDGLLFSSTDSHGHISIFGYGSGDPYKKVPDEQFFHTDYRPLIRDAQQHVLDEQTQCAPHLMPPPFLVDIDGNPYPPDLQRLVPGREHCLDSQLVPYVAVLANGESEILEPVRPLENEADEDRPAIDEMIEQLQQQQDHLLAAEGQSPPRSAQQPRLGFE
ncbi:hypothetical protein MRX96_011452 [Rhipicephalus microplus]